MAAGDKDNRTFLWSVRRVLGHLLGTTTVFIALFTFAWTIGFATAYLNGIHPFSPEILRIAARVEVMILYADIALCGFVSLLGMWRFCKDVIR